MDYIAEPFKIKSIEPLRITTREYRTDRLKEADYNLFGLHSDDVYIDLLTDSGTGAMSDQQWAGIMTGDEAYSGGRSYFKLLEVTHDIFHYDWIQPVHQGRAAEKVLFPTITRPGQYVVSNTLFDTTRGHVALAGGNDVDLPCEESKHSGVAADFKGNMDVVALENFITRNGADTIAAIVMTITNNAVGGQPVSLANLREVRTIADRFGLLVVIDAARYAENAYFIKQREAGYENASIRDITRETFALGDVFTMSAKKDAIVNIGGLLGVRDNPELVERLKGAVIAAEGFLTYGGLAGRDLEAMAIGLEEGLEESYLEYRIGQSQYLATKLDEVGIPYQKPVGGHGVFVDAGALLPQIPWHQFPGHALALELYLEAGIRSVDIGSFMLDTDPVTGDARQSPKEFTRLAIPRRVYTQSHLDVIAAALAAIKERADTVPGYQIREQAKVLRHFTAKLSPVT